MLRHAFTSRPPELAVVTRRPNASPSRGGQRLLARPEKELAHILGIQARHGKPNTPPPHFPPSLFPPDHRLSFPKCNTGALITRALTRRQQNNFKGLLEDSCPGSNFNMPLNRGDKIAIHVNCLPGLGGEMALWTRVLGGAGSRARMRRFAGKQRACR